MDAKAINEGLNFYLRPQTFPVAVKLLTKGEQLPEKVRIPSRDFGRKLLICQGMGLARRHGWTVAFGKEDLRCAPAATGLGFYRSEDLKTPEGSNPDYFSSKLDYGKYDYFLMSPLHFLSFDPDTLVIYGNAAQAMRLASSFGFAGQKTSAKVTAFRDCVDLALVSEKPEPTFILPSGGDRVFGGTQDFEVIFAMPWSMAETAVKGLETSHKMGFRYPVITDLSHEPSLPPFLDIEPMLG